MGDIKRLWGMRRTRAHPQRRSKGENIRKVLQWGRTWYLRLKEVSSMKNTATILIFKETHGCQDRVKEKKEKPLNSIVSLEDK
jgi:hypothetical protein